MYCSDLSLHEQKVTENNNRESGGRGRGVGRGGLGGLRVSWLPAGMTIFCWESLQG